MAQLTPFVPTSVLDVLGLAQMLKHPELQGMVSRKGTAIAFVPIPETTHRITRAAMKARVMYDGHPVQSLDEFLAILQGFGFKSDTPGWWYHPDEQWYRHWIRKLKSESE